MKQETIQITERNKYSTKDITAWVRQTLRSKYKDLKVSVRYESYSGGSSMSVCIIESNQYKLKKTIKDFSSEEIEMLKVRNADYIYNDDFDKYIKDRLKDGNLNQYHIDNDWTLTEKGKEIIKDIIKIANNHNYDNSDPMTDYFDVNYYLDISLGKWDKPFIDGQES